MLTDGLEQAIQKGIAVYKTFAVGGSGVGTIPVAKNKFIIVTGFDYAYFSDAEEVSEGVPDFLERSIFQLEFRSKTSQNHFIIRNEYAPIDVDGQIFYIPSGHYLKDVYLVHKENVQIDIVNVPSPENWSGFLFSDLPRVSQETPPPTGYGVQTGIQAVLKIEFSATEEYLPLTKKRDDQAVSNYREQFRVDVNQNNRLNPPLETVYGQYTFPILNVEYVEFSVPWNEFVKSSN